MTHNSNEFLGLCEKLKNIGIEFKIEPGCRLGRGFADVGSEEFYLLPNGKLLSIYTGAQSAYSAEQQRFFFVIPEAEDLVRIFPEYGLQLQTLNYVDQREWDLKVKKAESEKVFTDKRLLVALIQALIWAKNG